MSETVKRTISGVIYIVLLLSATLYDALTFKILFGFFMIVAAYEFAKLIQLSKYFCVGLSLVAVAAIFQDRIALPVQTLVILTFLILLAITAELFTTRKPNRSLPIKIILFLGYILGTFLAFMHLPYTAEGYQPQIVIGILILVWTNDTFAYIVGKKFGKHKLFERISPKKTIEGLLGGIVFAIIASLILNHFFTLLNVYIWIASAIFVGLFGTLGDLVESHFKREAGVKDSGNIMPGHGGILDRLDSILFISPFLYIIFQIL
ncbi:phosphatidate cytidylyltransferase [Myroides odoratus]|uniref:phosphatidate cytidylyltransferase n=1 Tax=Myroides odoratus TaxID=256 RepID=UPI000765DC85|nr:phosphatidate cytidylyltransferase [Myroides odoratus]